MPEPTNERRVNTPELSTTRKPGDGHVVFGHNIIGDGELREILNTPVVRWERLTSPEWGRSDTIRLGTEESCPVELDVHQGKDGGVHLKVRRGAAVAHIALGDMDGSRNQIQLAVDETDVSKPSFGYGWCHRIIVQDQGPQKPVHIGGEQSLEALAQPIWDGPTFQNRIERTEPRGGG